MKFETTEIVLIGIFSSLMGMLICCTCYEAFVVQPIKADAIEKGYAQWQVVNIKTGQTEFKFK